MQFPVFGVAVFDKRFDPDSLFRVAAETEATVDPETGAELLGFAADFATIRNLPEVAAPVTS